MYILKETDVCWESGLMTRRALSPDLITADHTMADLPTSRAQYFSRARSASGRFFYVFCGKSERESETEMRGEGLWESLITINRGEREGEEEEQPRSRAPSWIFCKDDGDCNENVKKWHVHQQNNNFACAAFSFPISCSCTTTTLKIFLLKIPRFDWGRQHEDRISLSGDRLLVRIIKSSQHKARNKRLSFLASPELIASSSRPNTVGYPDSSSPCLVTGNRPRDQKKRWALGMSWMRMIGWSEQLVGSFIGYPIKLYDLQPFGLRHMVDN